MPTKKRIGRPPKPKAEKFRHLTLRLHPYDYGLLMAERKRTRKSNGEIIGALIRKHIA